ncbi:hypothetical protein ACT7DL_30365 [Bacillus paranthracis]
MNQNKPIETEEKISIIQKMKNGLETKKTTSCTFIWHIEMKEVPWYAKLFTMLVVAYALVL